MNKLAYTVLFTLCVFLCCCSKKEQIDPQKQPIINPSVPVVQTNKPPGEFTATVLNVSDSSATVSWSKSIDPNKDSVSYAIYLDGKLLIAETKSLSYTLNKLKDLTTYNGEIRAIDTKGNEYIRPFSFTTLKYYRYPKLLDYPDGCAVANHPGLVSTMIKTRNGKYIVTGSSSFNCNSYRLFALMLDEQGNEIWKKSYDYNIGDSQDFKIIESSNGFIIASRYHVLKLDYNGNEIWYKKIASYDINDASSEIKSVAEDSKGNIYLVGGRGTFPVGTGVIQEAVLTKLDQSGNILFEKLFKPYERNFFFDINIDRSDQLVIIGTKETSGKSDYWFLRLENNGQIITEKTFGTTKYDFARKIIRTKDGNYIVVGFNDVADGRITKLSPTGAEIWNKSVPGGNLVGVDETEDGGIIATGYILVPGGSIQTTALGLYKFDSSTNLTWQKSYQGDYPFVFGRAAFAEKDGGFIVAGYAARLYYYGGVTDRQKILILKTDSSGMVQ
ncbi:fibronectin type III domain-containing protein [Mucilaginibacter calamicampi]|uniref:Fibronectin type III domain-containing protein n=1 Tax=Mucilaginibacter calamicampi TaxID=1302352 RepID=A0ABW2YYF6_9SPHI